MLNYHLDLVLLKIYQQATSHFKAQKNCNQFYIASKIKKEFDLFGYGLNNESLKKDDELKNLANKYGLSTYDIHNISGYIQRATPAAIVQMVKRIKKQVQK